MCTTCKCGSACQCGVNCTCIKNTSNTTNTTQQFANTQNETAPCVLAIVEVLVPVPKALANVNWFLDIL
ncbi:11402_t:CDS:2 [Dentiscutata erythropus]|uniref:11402_t:CDS:1 n=1 Tax=Dentiscutata erythropus TaxID=1348616 RepID=A0A9N9GF01_9GLOM|nr:11402_t:CDS:2 [Dentiscutata erythropus]